VELLLEHAPLKQVGWRLQHGYLWPARLVRGFKGWAQGNGSRAANLSFATAPFTSKWRWGPLTTPDTPMGVQSESDQNELERKIHTVLCIYLQDIKACQCTKELFFRETKCKYAVSL